MESFLAASMDASEARFLDAAAIACAYCLLSSHCGVAATAQRRRGRGGAAAAMLEEEEVVILRMKEVVAEAA